MNSNHMIAWPRTRPELTITLVHSTSTNRGYHESHYEVVCWKELDPSAFGHLDAAGLLGNGQEYSVLKHEAFTEVAQPAVVDRATGQVVQGAQPYNYRGEPYTTTHDYEWHRYVVRRICDSGD